MRKLNYGAAVSEALREEMERDENVFLIGEDIGSVSASDDLFAEFRKRRIWQTPISEEGFTGLSLGAAAVGLRPVTEIMFFDFVTVAMDQICNQAAKLNLMSGGKIKTPMVIRTPAGCSSRAGAHHSQSLEAWFMHTPGLKVVMPSSPYDAKGLLKTSIRDDGVVLFIQHRSIHGQTEEVPEGEWLVPFGEADVKREGTDVTIVTYSNALHKAKEAAEELAGDGISVEIVDPRTLVPLDVDTIVESVRKTGRLLVFHEATERGGPGAEIVRQVTRRGVDFFKAPPRVLGARDIPMPYSPSLEYACVPHPRDVVRAVRDMVKGA